MACEIGLYTLQGREVLQEFLESTSATEKFIRSVDEKLTESTQKYESKYTKYTIIQATIFHLWNSRPKHSQAYRPTAECRPQFCALFLANKMSLLVVLRNKATVAASFWATIWKCHYFYT